MPPNLTTRFRPHADLAAASIYETIREHDEEDAASDDGKLARPGQYMDSDFEVPSPKRGHSNQLTSIRNASPPAQRKNVKPVGRAGKNRRPHNFGKASSAEDNNEPEDDVPASLLIEDFTRADGSPIQHPRSGTRHRPSIVHQMHPEWDPSSPSVEPFTGQQFPLHGPGVPNLNKTSAMDDGREAKAMWRWANVENLDNHLAQVYEYYILKGFWSINLKRLLNLFTVAFIVGFTLFLTQCIDYHKVKGSTKLEEVLVRRCTARMGFVPNAVLWLTTFVCVVRFFSYLRDIRRLWIMHDFYHYCLKIPEGEVQSISWQEVVSRLMVLRDSNPNIRNEQRQSRFAATQNRQRMDAHDIANRLMRKENYMIAMINKEILDTSLALPFLGNRQFFTRTLEWHLNYCIMDYVFDRNGHIRQLFLKNTHRKALSEGLKRRFIFAASTSLMFAPILILYFIVQNFFQHFNEYQKDPAQIGSRQYNVYAQWKFREFNELWHLFDRRLKMSHPFAMRYINQFPKDKTVQAARFVTFVSGAIVAILGLATILDQENFLGFEFTEGRTTIFYLGIFGTIWAFARGMLPDDNMIYDSSYSMEEVIEFTHYRPNHWEKRLHTIEVKTEFEQLYQMQIVVLLEELLSMIFTPFVLWFSLPKSSDRIIDFFREFTVHVDGLGYVCSFAEFNFKKPGQTGSGDNAGTRATNPSEVAALARDDYYAAKDNKLEQSYWGFMNDYARNPKTDIRFAYGQGNRRKHFNMPPPFPGLLSPTLPQETRPSNAGLPTISKKQKVQEIPLAGLDAVSPPHSLLLDPHHQPGGGNTSVVSPRLKRPKYTMARSRIIPGPADPMMSTALKEEHEGDEQETSAARETADSRAGPSEGDLGSWKYDEDLESESEEDDDAQLLAQGGGVLGLIRQFQKSHDDGARGAAVV